MPKFQDDELGELFSKPVDAVVPPKPQESDKSERKFEDSEVDELFSKPLNADVVQPDKEEAPKDSLAALMRPQTKTVDITAPYRAGFVERAKSAQDIEKKYYDNRANLDEEDNRLLDRLDNVSKKYNIARGDLVAYALADGWIPKGEKGVGRLITSTLSDAAFNVDSAIERETQDEIFDPRAVQAITETRRAVQDSIGLARMGTQLVGEVGAGIATSFATGGASAPATAAKVASTGAKLARAAKITGAASAQGGVAGGLMGAALSDNASAISDEQFETQQRSKEIEQNEARSRLSPIRAFNDISRATSDYVGEFYANKVATSLTYQTFKKEYPKAASFAEGAAVGATVGAATGGVIAAVPMLVRGVRNRVAKETRTPVADVNDIAKELSTADSLETLSPQTQAFVAKHTDGKATTVEEARQTIFNTQPLPEAVSQDIANSTSVRELSDDSKAYLTKTYGNVKRGYRELVQPLRKAKELQTSAVNSALEHTNAPASATDELQPGHMEVLFNSVHANADGTMSSTQQTTRGLVDSFEKAFNNGLDIRGSTHRELLRGFALNAEQEGNKTVAKQLRSLANRDSVFLNDRDAVLKAIGIEGEGGLSEKRSPIASSYATLIADTSYNNWYERRFVDMVKSSMLDTQTREGLVKYIEGAHEKMPSPFLVKFKEKVDLARRGGNPADIEATLANNTTLAPVAVKNSLDTLQDAMVKNEFDKAYNQQDVLTVNRELKEAQRKLRTAEREAAQSEKDLAKESTRFDELTESIDRKLVDLRVPEANDEFNLAKQLILNAIQTQDRVPQDAIDYIAAYVVKDVEGSRGVAALATEAKAYNLKFEKLGKANNKYNDAVDDVVKLNKITEDYPEFREAQYTAVQKVVNFHTRVMKERGENVDVLATQLKDQTDLLVFGAEYVNGKLSRDLFNDTPYRKLVDDMEMALLSDAPIDANTILGLRDFAKSIRMNGDTRNKLSSFVRSLDKLDRIADNIENIADSLDTIERDRDYWSQQKADLLVKAGDAKEMAAAKLAIINQNLKRLGYNQKAVAELERMKSDLMPVLEARMNGAGLTTLEKRKIVRFLESDTFERIRQTQGDPDWMITTDDQVDDYLQVRNMFAPVVREHLASVYTKAFNKPFPEQTFFAHLITPVNEVDGTSVRLQNIFEIAGRAKDKTEKGLLDKNMRFLGNSETIDSIVTKNVGIAASAAVGRFQSDMMFTRKVGNALVQSFFKSVDSLRAFDGSTYKAHQNTQEFVEMRYRIQGVFGGDNEKFSFFVFNKKDRTHTTAPIYKALEEIAVSQKNDRYINFRADDVKAIVAKHFPENTDEANDYIRSYFGVRETRMLRPATLDVALKSAYVAKKYDLKKVDTLNKLLTEQNEVRGSHYPEMPYRADHVQYSFVSQNNPNIAETNFFNNTVFNFLSSSIDGQTSKLSNPELQVRYLMHPDAAVMQQTHGLSRTVLARDSVTRMHHMGVISQKMGYELDAKAINDALAGQVSVMSRNQAIPEIVEMFEDTVVRTTRPGFAAYQATKSLAQTLASSLLGQSLNLVVNAGQATMYGLSFSKKNHLKSMVRAATFAPTAAFDTLTSGVYDFGKFAAYGVRDLTKFRFGYPWKQALTRSTDAAIEFADKIGDAELRTQLAPQEMQGLVTLDHLDTETNGIVNRVLHRIIAVNNAVQIKFRLNEAVNAGSLSALDDSAGVSVQNGLLRVGEFFAKSSDRISTNFKERAETMMARQSLRNAARVYNAVVEDAVDAVTRGEIASVEDVANYISARWDKYSVHAGESAADVRRFANTIANEFAKKPEQRNYRVAMDEFLTYSNDLFQGRFGAASSPLFMNNLAKAVPGVNQFFSSITNGIYRGMRGAMQSKGPLTAREWSGVQAATGAAVTSALLYVLEYGAGKRVSDAFGQIVNLNEAERDHANSSLYADVLFKTYTNADGERLMVTPGSKKLQTAAYMLLSKGTGYPVWSMFDALIGSVAGGGTRGVNAAKEGNALEGVVAGFGNLPRMGGVALSVTAQVVLAAYGAARFLADDFKGDANARLLERDTLRNEQLNKWSKMLMQSIIPIGDVLNVPMYAFIVSQNPAYSDAIDKAVANDRALSEQPMAVKALDALGVKRNRYIQSMVELDTLFDRYNVMGGHKFAENAKRHDRRHLAFMSKQQRAAYDYIQNALYAEMLKVDGLDPESAHRRRAEIQVQKNLRENMNEASEQGLREIVK